MSSRLELKLSIRLGLGDCIYIWGALNGVKNNYKRIYVNADWHILKLYKNNSQKYKKFFIKFMELVYSDPCFILNSKTECPGRNLVNKWFPGIPPAIPRISRLCDNHPKKPNEDYIVITTKVREFNRQWFVELQSELMAEIKRLSEKYKIVVIGEREVEMNAEYKIHGSLKIYSLYNDFNNEFNFIDLTVPTLCGELPPDIDNIKIDCGLMRDAKAVITIGSGGNLALATATATNLIGIRKDRYRFMDSIYKNYTNNIKVSDNASQFLERLREVK